MRGLNLGHIGVKKLTGVWFSTVAGSTMGNRQWWCFPVVVGGAEAVGKLWGAEELLASVETRANPTENDWSTVKSPLDSETVLA
jgi:hypothetical protein